MSDIKTHRAPPRDLNAEAAIIQGVLERGNELVAAIDHLAVDDFQWPAHRLLYAAARQLAAAGRTVHPISVVDELRRQGVLDQIGTPDAAHHGAQAVHIGWTGTNTVTANTATDLANIVARCARARRLIAAADRISEAGWAGDIDAAIPGIEDANQALHGATLDENTWQLVDTQAVLAGDLDIPPPAYLHRTDHQALLYAGRTHAFNGESESGKSFLAIWACAERIRAGDHVLYLDFEDTPQGVIGRLAAFGVAHHHIAERFHYARPDDPLGAASRSLIDHATTTWRPTLAVLDGVTEVMVQNGWDIEDNNDAARFIAALPRPLERAGCSVVVIDHLAKDKKNQGRHAIGAQHKLAGISGASYRIEVVKPFGRGLEGTARIHVNKDRGGHIRAASNDGIIATLHLRSAPPRVTGEPSLASLICELAAPDNPEHHTDFRPTTVMEKVSRAIQTANLAGTKPSANQVKNLVRAKGETVTLALQLLREEGWLELAPGPRKDSLYHVVKTPYTEATDPKKNPPPTLPDPDDEPF